jgi:hypothetical protein
VPALGAEALLNQKESSVTREEAFRVLDLYRNWNFGQRSVALANRMPRTAEDDLYDERRALILKATKVLKEDKADDDDKPWVTV